MMGTTLQMQRVMERLDILSRRLHNAQEDITASLDEMGDALPAEPKRKMGKAAKELNKTRDEISGEMDEIRTLIREQDQQLQEKEIEMEQMRRLVMVDPLTGAYNRSAFSRHLDTHIAQARRFKTALSLLIIDIDKLQEINGSYGWSAGDELLSSFSRLIRRSIREYDMLFRIGGDRFAVLFPNEDLAHGKISVDRINTTVGNKTFRHNSFRFKITFSAGVAEFDGNEEWESLLLRAENLVWQAKQNGRALIFSEEPSST